MKLINKIGFAVILPAASFVVFFTVLILSRMLLFMPIIVSGASMEPTLYSGDVMMCFKVNGSDVSPGDIIIFDHDDKSLVKRVDKVLDGGERLWVLGDNAPVSNDSRYFGTVNAGDVRYVQRGKVLKPWEILPLLAAVVFIFFVIPMVIGEKIDKKIEKGGD